MNYFDRVKLAHTSKSVENIKPKLIIKQRHDIEEPEEEEQLKPKLNI